MDTEPKFTKGDLVYRTQDLISAKEGEELPGYIVHDPCVPTDMKRVGTGEPVNFYVEIHSVDPLENGGLYHQENLGAGEISQ